MCLGGHCRPPGSPDPKGVGKKPLGCTSPPLHRRAEVVRPRPFGRSPPTTPKGAGYISTGYILWFALLIPGTPSGVQGRLPSWGIRSPLGFVRPESWGLGGDHPTWGGVASSPVVPPSGGVGHFPHHTTRPQALECLGGFRPGSWGFPPRLIPTLNRVGVHLGVLFPRLISPVIDHSDGNITPSTTPTYLP